ncbi:hypothetical protein [Pediococcus claussenii]|uniref:hypothetical protein n=1 Tax=Pediococcus claussenii TaxID=187452 RepID=UPI00081A9373|nr:hypothetical protein [Pediococcus claussenii]ANZ70384.1 hypothetical protein AYR57_08670 [Pediococcus claussenii]ANZ72200.1 hypothetical protein AYR58_08670 [Pediococcus claussenii]
MDLDKIVQIITALGAILTGIFTAVHSYRKDKLADQKESERIKEYAMQAVREDNEDKRQQLDDLQQGFDDFKTKTDQELKLKDQRIAELTEELNRYKAKYGELEG